jgi:hypothetical protein
MTRGRRISAPTTSPAYITGSTLGLDRTSRLILSHLIADNVLKREQVLQRDDELPHGSRRLV